MENTQVIVMTDAVVARGQRAWKRIKATAAEQRELWREVGEALLVGRRLHKSDKLFGQWIKEHGFDDMKRDMRAGAIWLAESWSLLSGLPIPAGMSNPDEIRRWFNTLKTAAILPVELAEVEAAKVETIEIDQRYAERVAKVINRSKSNDEGAGIAKRHVDALAKKHNTTPEKLEEAVAAASPTTYFQFPPAQVQSLTEFRQDLMQAYRDMLSEGIPKEAVIAIYMNVINEIKKGD